MYGFIKGLQITILHFFSAFFGKSRKSNFPSEENYFSPENNDGIFTLDYPDEKMTLPPNARYELHNEIDDCILCDKCAEICPVNCIEIESIRSPEAVRFASDGSPVRFYAAKFDIDMAKCCFCGLCTTVCPTECLTMSPRYEVAVVDFADMNFSFAKMLAEEIDQRKAEWEIFQENKKIAETKKSSEKSETLTENNSESSAESPEKPKIKIKIQPPKEEKSDIPAEKIPELSTESPEIEKPERPKIKVKIPTKKDEEKSDIPAKKIPESSTE